jgi:imidazolonepropionase-like amidohydrolase
MKPADVLRSATSVNADVFKLNEKLGRIKAGLYADIIAVQVILPLIFMTYAILFSS